MTRKLALVAALGLAIPVAAAAEPLAGKFTFSSLGDVRVGTNSIDWGEQPASPGAQPIFGTPIGDILFLSGTDAFTSLAQTTGTIKDLTNPPAVVGAPITVSNFITSTIHPEWNFTLTMIDPGTGTAAGCTDGNQQTNCTPPGSPFTIVDSGNDSAVTMRMSGLVTDMGVGTVSSWQGIFTTQFTGMTSAQILAELVRAGFVQSSYSAEVRATPQATPVPEPMSLLLLGTGLVATGGLVRKRDRK